MDRALKPGLNIFLGKNLESFNPYFYGSRIKALNSIYPKHQQAGVSILIFMDRALKQKAHTKDAIYRHRVSILIFMDRALKPLPEFVNKGTSSCFNPYFYGSRIKADKVFKDQD